jgi:hypothetical protein
MTTLPSRTNRIHIHPHAALVFPGSLTLAAIILAVTGSPILMSWSFWCSLILGVLAVFASFLKHREAPVLQQSHAYVAGTLAPSLVSAAYTHDYDTAGSIPLLVLSEKPHDSLQHSGFSAAPCIDRDDQGLGEFWAIEASFSHMSVCAKYALRTHQVSTTVTTASFFEMHVNFCTDLERSRYVLGIHASTNTSINQITRD